MPDTPEIVGLRLRAEALDALIAEQVRYLATLRVKRAEMQNRIIRAERQEA